MVDSCNIGDGQITMVDGNLFKTFNGNITVVRIEDNFHIEVKRQLIIPCEEVISRSIQNETVILQFKMDYVWEKAICKFHDNTQAIVFNSKLPSIMKPIDDNLSTR